jgi:hypothetical protein
LQFKGCKIVIDFLVAPHGFRHFEEAKEYMVEEVIMDVDYDEDLPPVVSSPWGGHSVVKLKIACKQENPTFSKLHHRNGSKFYQIFHE